MTDLDRCLSEQRRCAGELLANPDHPERQGLKLGLADWALEEVFIRLENER
jgi:hypothetical protein